MKVIFGTDPIKYPLTGIGRYAYELAHCLQQQDEIDQLLFLNGRRISREIPTMSESTNASQGLRRMVQKSRSATEVYRLTAPWLKTMALKPHCDAIYHSPNFYLPPQVERCVTTFHDLSIFTWPQCHPPERVRFMQKELLLAIKRASVFITVTEFARQELATYFNLPLTRIFTSHLASSGDFSPRTESEMRSRLERWRLTPGGYCLFTGSIEPRKNIVTLLDAYERLPIRLRQSYPLIVSGYQGWVSEGIHQRFGVAERQGWLRYLGYMPSADLPYLFAGAKSFLFPSLYEGFGLPVLEAMASGTPVVCSDAASLPEVVGDCALMCAPEDTETLTEIIQRSIEDDAWRRQARAKGIARAQTFSWQRCARETIHAYRQVQ
ncbi:TPA: glycosyltransferase family 4 protein [Enterobacter asburiae]|uniref:glycosyltransferase family 4 protein n=1 Tax=Enterobacter sp. EC_64 TaxID=2584092 RepID=UPI001C702087|nr:glycosyltransferase family 1 protein [Enterobacter sp. EC_64]MBW9384858.1 glycosyltransferase family 4 protein [Enterobacter sp. EC_64]